MRILHTSDWHLGRSFHRVGLLEHQALMLDALIEVVRAERVEVVVVAGDVYDRALPGVDAVSVLDDALARLLGTGAQVVITSGNHDSPTRLGFAGPALERAGLHLRTRVGDLDRPVVIPDAWGPVAFYGLPYLEPCLVATELAAPATHAGVTAAAMSRVRTDLARRRAAAGELRAVVAAHTFVSGGASSDSERDLVVGGLGAVGLEAFTGCPAGSATGGGAGAVDYVALGHLHGRQQLSEAVRYSGSPLAYSFSEASQVKGAWLVELGAGGLGRVEAVPTVVPRPLACLRGHLADLLADPSHERAEAAWCQVVLTDAARPREAMEALRTRFPHVVSLAFEPDATHPVAGEGAPSYAARVAGLDDTALCCSFVEHVRGAPAAEGERELLTAALAATGVAAAHEEAARVAAAGSRARASAGGAPSVEAVEALAALAALEAADAAEAGEEAERAVAAGPHRTGRPSGSLGAAG